MSDDPQCSAAPDFSDSTIPLKKRRCRIAAANKDEEKKCSLPVAPPAEKEAESAKKETRRWETWNHFSVSGFYEALKEHGKNFEAIGQWMAKKKCQKEYGQIRNFYYNSIKQIANSANLNDARVPKEAKELFLLINYEEWKRKTHQSKVNNSEKFKELIMKGTTSVKVKVKGKQKKETIRTPICPALKKFCVESSQSESKVPVLVTLELVPRTYGDKAYVLSCEQNPLVRLRLNPNEALQPYFAFLRRKWTTPDAKLKEDLLKSGDRSTVSISLHPCSSVQLCEPTIRTKAVGPVPVSLERCIEMSAKNGSPKKPSESTQKGVERQESAESSQTPESGTDSNDAPATTDDDNSRGEAKDSADTVTLDSTRLKSGLTEENVDGMTAGELSLICKSSSVIRLSYSIETAATENEKLDPWSILMTLIMRGYGEDLHKAVSNPNSVQDPQKAATIATPAAAPGTPQAAANLCTNLGVKLPSPIRKSIQKKRGRNSKKSQPAPAQPASNQFFVMGAIGQNQVEFENRLFQQQREQMQAQMKKNKRGSSKKPKEQTDQSPSLVARPLQPPVVMMQQSFPVVTIPSPVRPEVPGPELVAAPPAKTPEKSEQRPVVMSLFSSPGITALLNEMSVPDQNAPSSSAERQLDFSNVAQQSEGRAVSAINFDQLLTSPPKGPKMQLPNDVRVSFDQMMNQNSVDFCRNFQALADRLQTSDALDTPKKQT